MATIDKTDVPRFTKDPEEIAKRFKEQIFQLTLAARVNVTRCARLVFTDVTEYREHKLLMEKYLASNIDIEKFEYTSIQESDQRESWTNYVLDVRVKQACRQD